MRAVPALSPLQPRSRTGLGVVVLGLHAVALLGALRLGAWGDRHPPPPAQPPLVVWLDVASPPPRRADRPDRASPRPPPPAVPRAARKPREPQAITPPAPARAPEAAAEATAAAATAPVTAPVTAPGAAPPGPAVLNLSLPHGASAPWRGRNPALDDPRANTPRPTLDSRIAAALGGSDRITEFHLEDGSVQFRRGKSCVVARPNRASTLDPFNASAQLRPRLIEGC